MGQKGRGMSIRRRGEGEGHGRVSGLGEETAQGEPVRREGPVQGQVPGEKHSRARCWGRALVGALNAVSFLLFWLLTTVNFSSYFC